MNLKKKYCFIIEIGDSYAEIAEKLESKVKSIDTAIQRVRKKAIKIKQRLEKE